MWVTLLSDQAYVSVSCETLLAKEEAMTMLLSTACCNFPYTNLYYLCKTCGAHGVTSAVLLFSKLIVLTSPFVHYHRWI